MFYVACAFLVGCTDDRTGVEGILHFDDTMIGSDAGDDAPPVADASIDTRRDDAATDAPTDVPITDMGVDAGSAFVPSIPFTYAGSVPDPGIEILAFAIVEDPFSFAPNVYISVRGTTASLNLCALDLTVTYFNASGSRVGVSRGLVETHPYRGLGGTGGLLSCMSVGEVGMQDTILELDSGWTVDDIASATWANGALNVVDAVRTSNLVATGVGPTLDGSRVRFRGSVENRSSESIRNPNVTVFGVNSVGRPLFAATDVEVLTVPPFGNWSFETLSVPDEPYDDLMVFVEARTP